jgi:hypothetical protein
MRSILAGLRLYNLSEGSLVSAELAAYDAAFLVIEELLGQLRRDSFVSTAEGEALRRFERLVGLPEREERGDSGRRELILYRMSIAPFDFTPEGMLRSVRAAGVEASLTEDPANERLVIHSLGLIDPTLTHETAVNRLEKLVPAHLDWDLDFGFTDWTKFDRLGYTWEQLDGLDFDWDHADVGLEQLTVDS